MSAIQWFMMRALLLTLTVAALLLLPACHNAPITEQADRDPSADPDESPVFFTYPHDGQLYAALECVPITPTCENHPRKLFMGGTSGNRIAEGTHDELEACALLMGQDEDILVLVSIDLVGILDPRVNKMKNRLEAIGIDRDRVFACSTHTHTGPDSLGMYGSEWFLTGLDRIYQDFLCDAVEAAVASAGPEMVPVTATFATDTIFVPESTYPALIRDSRDPVVIDDRIHAIRFDSPATGTVATLVNFANHAEVAICYNWFSADYPRYLRERLSMEYGGGAIFFPGAVGGLMTPIGVSVPARDEQGGPVYEEGEPVWLTDCTWDRTRSYGYFLAEIVIEALAGRSPSPVDGIRVDRAEYVVPITNTELWGANLIGVVERFPLHHGPGCGPLGCGTGELHVIAFGDAQITTSPGETFPETIIGRDEVTIDYGDPWGTTTFGAMEGLLDHHTRPVAMHFGLTNHEIGYLIPECDFLPIDHPEHYCEYFAVSRQGETILRETLIELLDRQAAQERR